MMGKSSKDPKKIAKKQIKKEDKNKDTLSEKYNYFDKIDYSTDSSSEGVTNTKNDNLKGRLPIIDSNKNLEFMIQQGIQEYMVGKDSNIHCGIGKPLTQKEFDQLQESSKVVLNH